MPEAPAAAPSAAAGRSPAAARRPQLGQAKAGGGGHNITVAVRVRPLNAKEVQRNSWSCLSLQEGRQINVIDPDEKMGGVDYLRLDKTKDKSYAFDHALDESMSQEDVFRCTTQGLVPGCLLGHNSCVFAYGATGSGKTFTMAGSLEQPGVIPLTLAALFAACAEAEGEYSTLLRMQYVKIDHPTLVPNPSPIPDPNPGSNRTPRYVEIYNEQIKDLLEPSSVSLDVREDPKRGTFVAGATSRVVTSHAELEGLLHTANLYRTTDATNCNEASSRPQQFTITHYYDALRPYYYDCNCYCYHYFQVSSRSHAVLQLQLETTARFGEVAEVRAGKLPMILLWPYLLTMAILTRPYLLTMAKLTRCAPASCR